jgi:hypothetical protein
MYALLAKVEIVFKGILIVFKKRNTDTICNIAKQISLKINANKTKVMMVNPKTEGTIHIAQRPKSAFIDHVSGQSCSMGHGRQTKE